MKVLLTPLLEKMALDAVDKYEESNDPSLEKALQEAYDWLREEFKANSDDLGLWESLVERFHQLVSESSVRKDEQGMVPDALKRITSQGLLERAGVVANGNALENKPAKAGYAPPDAAPAAP